MHLRGHELGRIAEHIAPFITEDGIKQTTECPTSVVGLDVTWVHTPSGEIAPIADPTAGPQLRTRHWWIATRATTKDADLIRHCDATQISTYPPRRNRLSRNRLPHRAADPRTRAERTANLIGHFMRFCDSVTIPLATTSCTVTDRLDRYRRWLMLPWRALWCEAFTANWGRSVVLHALHLTQWAARDEEHERTQLRRAHVTAVLEDFGRYWPAPSGNNAPAEHNAGHHPLPDALPFSV